MSKLINKRWLLINQEPSFPAKPYEKHLAQDVQTQEFNWLYLVKSSKPTNLIDAIISRRVEELKYFQHPIHLQLLEYGYEGEISCFYFVYEYIVGRVLGKLVFANKQLLKNYAFPKEEAIDVLLQISDYLNRLHAREIVHGGLETSEIFSTEDGSVRVLKTGLASFIPLLISDGKAMDFEDAKLRDIRDFSVIAFELLVGQSFNNFDNFDTLSLTVGEKSFLMKLFHSSEEFEKIASFTVVRKYLMELKQEIDKNDTYYMRLSRKSVENLHEVGLIPVAYEYMAYDFVNSEIKQNVYAKFHIYEDTSYYRFTTNQLVLYCQPEKQCFVITRIDLGEATKLAQDRDTGLYISCSLKAESLGKLPENSNIAILEHEIKEYSASFFEKRSKERDSNSKISRWESVLQMQKSKLQTLSIPYLYLDIIDNGNTIDITLDESYNMDDVNILMENMVALTVRSNQKQSRAGYIESIRDNIVRVARSANVDPSIFRSSGVISVFNIQEESVIKRQEIALRKLRLGNTTNPYLRDILLEPSRLVLGAMPYVDIWLQMNLDDSQKNAVRSALATKDIFLIQGPPGTGKTSVITELVRQILEKEPNARILVASQSNVAVNHALTRIVNERQDAHDVVRLGMVEKVGNTEDLLLDRQLSRWAKGIVDKSKKEFERIESESSGGEALRDALGVLSECETSEQYQKEQMTKLEKTKHSLEAVEEVYQHSQNVLTVLDQFRQNVDVTLSKVALKDDWLNRLLVDFHDNYLNWASEFLARVDEASNLSFRRVELMDIVEEIEEQIFRLNKEVESGTALINDYLLKNYKVTFGTLQEQKVFIDRNFAGKQEQMARIGRLRKVLEDWHHRVTKAPELLSSAYLAQCHIVGATCLGIGRKSEIGDVDFDWVIIDEAGRATHPEILIPMVKGRKLVLVGDHRQLPPILGKEVETAIQEIQNISKQDLEISLFQDLMSSAPQTTQVPLRVQYRMHPYIGRLISECFYEGLLESKTSEGERDHHLPWCKSAVIWYSTKNLPNHYETKDPSSNSFLNQAEVDQIINIMERISETYSQANINDKTIGVITAYQGQKQALQSRVGGYLKKWGSFKEIEIDTVDAYQGRERDIIIYSIVRSNLHGKVGFLKDERRLNVALSRARDLLIIVGDEDVAYADIRASVNPFFTLRQHFNKYPDQCRLERINGTRKTR